MLAHIHNINTTYSELGCLSRKKGHGAKTTLKCECTCIGYLVVLSIITKLTINVNVILYLQ